MLSTSELISPRPVSGRVLWLLKLGADTPPASSYRGKACRRSDDDCVRWTEWIGTIFVCWSRASSLGSASPDGVILSTTGRSARPSWRARYTVPKAPRPRTSMSSKPGMSRRPHIGRSAWDAGDRPARPSTRKSPRSPGQAGSCLLCALALPGSCTHDHLSLMDRRSRDRLKGGCPGSVIANREAGSDRVQPIRGCRAPSRSVR